MEDRNSNIIPPQTAAPILERFTAAEEEYVGFKKSKAVILKAPYEKTVTYKKGTVSGPNAIIEASKYLEQFDDELNQETYKIGIHIIDLAGMEELPSEGMVDKVHWTTSELLKANKFPVILGGEHSVSIGAVKALKEAYPNLSVLQLDAHYDLRNELKGSRFNHGCTARRINEMVPLTQVGMRSLSKEEKEYSQSAAPHKLKSVNVYDILEMPLWKDVVSDSLTENVYITIDLDVFDPSIAPGVGTPEPGGMGWYEILDLLKLVSKDKKVVGFDVVELCPIPQQFASDFLAAKLVYRMLGYIFPNKK